MQQTFDTSNEKVEYSNSPIHLVKIATLDEVSLYLLAMLRQTDQGRQFDSYVV